jgi:HMG (high mobility group) box
MRDASLRCLTNASPFCFESSFNYRSPYILFSISKMQEYRDKLKQEKVTSLSSQISKEWKALPEAERNRWKRAAEEDKHRYNAEKSLYQGPWRVSAERPRKVRLAYLLPLKSIDD